MFPIRSALCAALCVGLLSATPAEARFGKHSNTDSSQSDSRDDDHDAAPDDRDTHAATAIGTDEPEPRREERHHRDGPHGVRVVDPGISFWHLLFGWGSHDAPRYLVDDDVPEESLSLRRHAAPLSLRMGLQGGPMGGGGVGDAFLGFDAQRFGFVVQATGLVLPTDDGSPGTDSITLLEGHLTYALVALEPVRLRLEAGLSTATAPDIRFVGLSFGLSMEACIVGPVDFEARVQATPFPYRQVDASAALALHLGAVVVRGGVRGLVLDDAGEVDGVQHIDSFGGPFLGVGLAF
ncbi:hypothetical protein KRR26_31540 [Corallococcus sp. M34]|uniref:hypothetical protein n=1 Tax=Citreicoccus inhibens TaxID=2849499 RepID=UPI001C23D6CF|nr:hypothetical protein [Citreicoccus inhibens]MBU8900149.1 hypothetical protein [Citreicoccus inhibens]